MLLRVHTLKWVVYTMNDPGHIKRYKLECVATEDSASMQSDQSLLYVHSSFAIILIEKRELVALLSLSSWCLMIVVWLFLAVPWVCLQFVIVVFPDHTHILFSMGVLWVAFSWPRGYKINMPGNAAVEVVMY